MGRSFIIENPHGSDIWSESALEHLRSDNHMTVLDHCQYGATLEDQYILKATDLLSNVQLPGLAQRCPGDHPHLHLRGTNNKGSRTAQSAVYPQALCGAILEHVRDHVCNPSTSDGGRLCIHFDALRDPSNHKACICSILSELRVHAIRKGLLDLWDKYVKVWINDAFNKNIPLLPENAELHLTSTGPTASRAVYKSPPPPRGMALRLPSLESSESTGNQESIPPTRRGGSAPPSAGRTYGCCSTSIGSAGRDEQTGHIAHIAQRKENKIRLKCR